MVNKLLPLEFKPLKTGEVKPLGWLRRQLRIQADGLSGHLDEFWPDIQHSRWFGGDAEGWERAPYWLDGFVPLAFLLEDEKLIHKARNYVDTILANQQENGWLGPVEKDPRTGVSGVVAGYDCWAELLVFKVLVEYHRAVGEERILLALEKALRFFDRFIDTRPLFNWGQFRWFEGLIAIFYLYEHDPQDWLLELAVKIEAQGFNWGHFFHRWPYPDATPRGRWSYMSHVVNNAMAVKAHGLWRRLSGQEEDQFAVYDMLAKLDRFHGMVTGMFSGDECLAGKNPTQGTELCAVNEYLYSLEWLVSLLGDAGLGDRLEKIAYNALPATFSPDMWCHQYDQQVNQVECSVDSRRPWTTNGPESNLFGLEPNFGCCTANLSQGWPKFCANLWMSSRDDGLAAVAYAPCKVDTEIRGVAVGVEVLTDYPFKEQVKIRVAVGSPVSFPLYLRIPGWAKDARAELATDKLQAVPGEFLRIDRQWVGEVEINLAFPMPIRQEVGHRGAVALSRGPLVFALRIEEEWRQVHADCPLREAPHADYEVFARSPWNYGLVIDPASGVDHFKVFTQPPGEYPFSPSGAPVTLSVPARRLENWGMKDGSADEIPLHPLARSQAVEDVQLIPYGCTNLRITEFPLFTA